MKDAQLPEKAEEKKVKPKKVVLTTTLSPVKTSLAVKGVVLKQGGSIISPPVVLKHANSAVKHAGGRPRKKKGYSRTTAYRRKKELQGVFNLT
jgi:phage baseplate assembly protein gpV